MKTWNRERIKTRDRLLDYNSFITPLCPNTNYIPTVYPAQNTSLELLADQIFMIAQQYGYKGQKDSLFTHFNNGMVHFYDHLIDFPLLGNQNDLYIDKQTQICYYFIIITQQINNEEIERIGGFISNISEDANKFFVYLPLRALTYENTIFDGGDATDYID